MFAPVNQNDINHIVRLNDLCGFPERSVEGWRWVLFDNPQQGAEPPGYVHRRDDQIVGFSGIQRRVLRRQDETISLTCGHTSLTNLKAPGAGLKLLRHAFKSQSGDMVSTLNNNPLSAPLYPRLDMQPLPNDEGRYFLELTVDFTSYALSAGLRRLANAHKKPRTELFRYNYQHALDFNNIGGFRRINPHDPQDAEALNALHETMIDGPLFQADRSAKTWQHRCADPDAPHAMHLFASFKGGKIEAFLAMSVTKETELHPATAEIDDMAIQPDCRISLVDLLNTAEAFARKSHLAKVRLRFMRGVTTPSAVLPARWTLRKKDYDNIHIFSRNPAHLNDWAIGPMDGDFYFSLRRQNSPDKISQRQVA